MECSADDLFSHVSAGWKPASISVRDCSCFTVESTCVAQYTRGSFTVCKCNQVNTFVCISVCVCNERVGEDDNSLTQSRISCILSLCIVRIGLLQHWTVL